MAQYRARALALACLALGGVGATATTPDLAQAQTALVEKAVGKPVTASSFEKAGLEAAKGNDNNMTTRWGSAWTDGQWWQVDLGSAQAVSQVKVAWEGAYASKYRVSTSVDGTSWTTAAEESAAGAGERTTSPAERNARYVRLTAVTRGTRYGISFYELKVLGAQETLVEKAAGKAVSASSFEKAGLEAAKGNDSNATTRWGSAWSDGQWWQVDLGSARSVSQVKVNWEHAYASKYRISTSTDGTNWTTAAEESATGAGERTTSFASRTGRYLRLTAVTRATRYGISFHELKVLGGADAAAVEATTTTEPVAATTTETTAATTETTAATTEPVAAPTTELVEKAAGKAVSASSFEKAGVEAAKGNDSNVTTRWGSAWSDGQWWQVDLGSNRAVSQLKVNWEGAYASKYRISTSTDGTSFTTAAEETAPGAGERTTSFASRNARYVRVTGITRGTQYGISFHEAKVLGPNTDPAPTTETTAPTTETTTASTDTLISEPVASLLPKPLVPLASGNPFTTPLPTTVPLHSASEQDAFRNELRYIVNASGTRVEQSQYSAALYTVYRNGDVYDSAGRKKASGVPFVKPSGPIAELNGGIEGRGWPIASWMKPDPGEGHMVIYNPETGALGDFIYARVGSGSFSYGWGGYIKDARQSKGMSSQPNPWWGGTAFGLNLASFTITEHEIRKAVERYQAGDYANAYIPHVIGYEAYRHHPNQWYYPASKTDDIGSKVPRWGEGGDYNRLGNGTGVLRMGGIFRLDPSINVQTQIKGDGTAFGDMMARIIARTYQKHGATMTDQTEAGFALLAEHVRKTDGSYDTGAFSYGSGAPWGYGQAWLKPMMNQIVDNKWTQFVYTGRNLEADTGGSAPAGAYRPAR
jgi:hypothetical protein